MRIAITGTHGIPARYGGFETFAFHLAKACASQGIKTTVINEKDNPAEFIHENIRIINSQFNKSSSPLKFYKDSLQLASASADIILSCGVGGSIYYSSIKNNNISIITNVDGLEHLRKRYSLLQRLFVYYLQNKCAKASDHIVTDSASVESYWLKRFPSEETKIIMLPYGADIPLSVKDDLIDKFGLKKNQYFLVIARLVPENNIHTIIEAFKEYKGRKKLVIIGHPEQTSYVKKLKSCRNESVIFPGANYDKDVLDSLRKNCFMYIHGHSVGGTNPSLLEAMAAGCACICQENDFNREVTNREQLYFHDSLELSVMMNILDHDDADLIKMKTKAVQLVKDNYSWQEVCNSYIRLFTGIYNDLIKKY